MNKLSLFVLLTMILCLTGARSALATTHSDKTYSFSLHGSMGHLKPEASPYLGTQIGAGPNIFNFVEANDTLDLKAKGFSFTYKPSKNFEIFTNFEDGRADGNQSFNTLDPAGTNLLIPGVGVGPSGAGFLLPGPNNQITNAYYDTEINYYKIMLGVRNEFKTPLSNLTISPSFGVGYSRSITQNSFNGNIPFFTRSLVYNTKTEITTVSPTLGIDTRYRISPLFQIFGGAQYAYDLNNGKGTDSLAFTGFTDQVANITNDENTHHYALKAGLVLTPKNFPAISFQGNYQRSENIPVIKNRDGINKSDFSYEDADLFSATLRMTFEF